MASDSGTIFALSSGAGRSGLAVIRLSGPDVRMALKSLTGNKLAPSRQMALRSFVRPHDGELIDRGLVVWFDGPRSVTGEDVGEIHIHGGRAIVNAILTSLSDLGLRQAEPGEFTRRAFENGKLDLTEAEGIADLIAAETEMQRRQAVRQMAGALGTVYENWRTELVRAAALLEAVIDFPDEDVPCDTFDQAVATLSELSRSVGRHLGDHQKGERLRDGFRVAVVGAPNVGKSSLVNALAQRDVAIVSDLSGTTRDVIEVHLDLAGIPVIISDTAGLREANEPVEEEGIKRAKRAAAEADIRILMFDLSERSDAAGPRPDLKPGDIVAGNKADLASAKSATADKYPLQETINLSVKSGQGMAELLDLLLSAAADRVGSGMEVNLTRHRHRVALEECLEAIDRCLNRRPGDIALWAEDVRLAARALGRITGKTDVETILDSLFSEFCIGK